MAHPTEYLDADYNAHVIMVQAATSSDNMTDPNAQYSVSMPRPVCLLARLDGCNTNTAHPNDRAETSGG